LEGTGRLDRTGGAFLQGRQLKIDGGLTGDFNYESLVDSVGEAAMKSTTELKPFRHAHDSLWERYYRLHRDHIAPLIRDRTMAVRESIDAECAGWETTAPTKSPSCPLEVALRMAELESKPGMVGHWENNAHKTVVALREFIWRVHGYGVEDGEHESFEKYGGELAWLEKVSLTDADKPVWRKPSEAGTRSAEEPQPDPNRPFIVYATFKEIGELAYANESAESDKRMYK
jgi:hypothetical protein